MRPFLNRYPDREAARLLAEGFSVGFRIPGSMAAIPHMVLLELFPVVLVMELWDTAWRNLKIRLNCDNMGVVQVVNQLSASSQPVIRLLRHLVCLQLNVFLYAVHIPGIDNTLADSLSQFQWDRFRELAPAAEKEGIPCPGWLWEMALKSPQDGSGGR